MGLPFKAILLHFCNRKGRSNHPGPAVLHVLDVSLIQHTSNGCANSLCHQACYPACHLNQAGKQFDI